MGVMKKTTELLVSLRYKMEDQMSPSIQTELKIPDLWYDFYTRLIPGTAFIASTRILFLNSCKLPIHWQIFIIISLA